MATGSSGAQSVWVVVDSKTAVRFDRDKTLVFVAGPTGDQFDVTPLPRRTMDEINTLAKAANIAVAEQVAPAVVVGGKGGGTEL